jgi:hypothetical protein
MRYVSVADADGFLDILGQAAKTAAQYDSEIWPIVNPAF